MHHHFVLALSSALQKAKSAEQAQTCIRSVFVHSRPTSVAAKTHDNAVHTVAFASFADVLCGEIS